MSFDPLLAYRRAEPYLEEVDRVARARGEDIALLVALGSRETEWGWAPGYHPRGSPDGTGDWVARRGAWLSKPGVRVVRTLADLPKGWSVPRQKGLILPGPYAIPGDGLGWGRGLLQLDFCGDFRGLYRPAPWPVMLQVEAACEMLALARRQLAELDGHPLFARAVLAGYNARRDRILDVVRLGRDPDAVTTPGPRARNGAGRGDYGRDVEERAAAMRAAFPFQFAPPLSPAPVPEPTIVNPGGES